VADGAWGSRSELREVVPYPACQLSPHPASAPRKLSEYRKQEPTRSVDGLKTTDCDEI
jgi:hypothetical protein